MKFYYNFLRKRKKKPDKKSDRRVLRTKRSIRQAFSKLLSQQDLTEVTVKDIADTADINRKTFYNYYDDVDDVVGEIEEEVVSEFSVIIEKTNDGQISDRLCKAFSEFTEVLSKEHELYGNLFGHGHSSSLIAKVTEILKKKVASELSEKTALPEDQRNIYSDYIASGIIAVYTGWLSMEERTPVEYVANKLGSVINSGIINLK